MFAVFATLAVLSSIARPDLANLTWAGAVWSRELGGWTVNSYRAAAGSLIILILYDFIWVFINFDYLVFSIHQDPLENLYRFAFVIGLFNFILKILLFIVVVKSYIIVKDQEANNIISS